MIEDKLYTYLKTVSTLTDLVGGATTPRIYPDQAPSSATLPYVTFLEIPGEHEEHMQAAAGLANVLMQIDVWAATSVSRAAVVAAINTALLGYRGQSANFAGVQGAFSEGTPSNSTEKPVDGSQQGIKRAMMQFRIWFAETVPTFS